MNLLPYLPNLIIGFVALANVLKDWKQYRETGPAGKSTPVIVYLLIFVLTGLNIYRVWQDENTKKNLDKQIQIQTTEIQTQSTEIKQLKKDLDDANTTLAALKKDSESNGKKIGEVKQAQLNSIPKKVKLLPFLADSGTQFNSFDEVLHQTSKKIIRIPSVNSQITIPLHYFNSSDDGAKNVTIGVVICYECKYISVPPEFRHLTGTPELERAAQIAGFPPKGLAGEMPITISVPSGLDRIWFRAVLNCENCLAEPIGTNFLILLH